MVLSAAAAVQAADAQTGKAKHPKKPVLTDKEISDIAAWASSPS